MTRSGERVYYSVEIPPARGQRGCEGVGCGCDASVGRPGTVTIGLLIGFLVPTISSDLSPQPDIQASVPESPLARQFINAFAADDKGALDALKVRSDIELRASRFRADYARVDTPIHLGSFVGGGYTVHAYGIHVVRRDGTGGHDQLARRDVRRPGRHHPAAQPDRTRMSDDVRDPLTPDQAGPSRARRAARPG